MPQVTPLTEAEITDYLKQFPDWTREGDTISRTFKADTYMAGLALAAAIGTICDVVGHHPDLYIGWKKIRVSFTTHDAGNRLSARDFEAARKVNELGYSRD
jgi:4a-hydroxytetrahydrobiopterin dehydratase